MEICVDSVQSARNAVSAGASRLELCAALSEGGLTPTPGLLKIVKECSTIPVYAMIRIRTGNFLYTREEMDAMLYDVKILKELRADGFVFGALTQNRDVNEDFCGEILCAADPLPVTFHRAFDETRDPFKSLEIVIKLGFERILSSGQKDTAEEGLGLLASLVRAAAGRISIMPGSGITKDNILRIKNESGAKEFHASAKTKKETCKNDRTLVKIGSGAEKDCLMVTDRDLVKEMVKIVRNS